MTTILNWLSVVFNDPLVMLLLGLFIVAVIYSVKAAVLTIVAFVREEQQRHEAAMREYEGSKR